MCTEKLVNFMIIRECIERKTDWIFLSLLDRPYTGRYPGAGSAAWTESNRQMKQVLISRCHSLSDDKYGFETQQA